MESGKLIIDDVVDLNTLNADGDISCPYCKKGKAFVYTASGMVSLKCGNCHRMVLWDFDHGTAYKANMRKYR